MRDLLVEMGGVERSDIPCLGLLEAQDQISEADLAAKAAKREARLLEHPEEREILRRPRNTSHYFSPHDTRHLPRSSRREA